MIHQAPPSPLDRALRLIGDVRAGEGARAAVLGLTVFLLLSSYYLLKVAREALLLSSFSAEVKAQLSGVQALVLLGAVWAFGWIATRASRIRLLAGTTVALSAMLSVFAVLAVFESPEVRRPLSVVFYIWAGVFNVFVISQFWAFANDLYREDQGRRLFAVIGVGSSVGAIAGSYLAAPIGRAMGTTGVMFSALVLLLGTLVPLRWASGQGGLAARPPSAAEPRGAFSLLRADRYLVLIAGLMVLLNLENTVGEYIVDRIMREGMRAELLGSGLAEAELTGALEPRIRELKSYYFAVFNALALVLQLLAAGRIMRWGGAGAAILVLPVVALMGQAAMAVSGMALMAVLGAKVFENGVDYSIQNTGRNGLFLITSREVKYKVKVLVDTVLVRLGDVLAAVLVSVGSIGLGLDPAAFVAVNLVITLLWLAVAISLARRSASGAVPDAAHLYT